MADIVSPETRSRMMAGIRGKDTRPEFIVRRGLFTRGLRYRLHDGRLPGRPDLVFPRFRAVVFVSGCFWHGHGCRLFRWPSTNPEFWRTKITGNRERDRRVREEAKASGWRVATVWECALRGRGQPEIDSMLDGLAEWIRGGDEAIDLPGSASEPSHLAG